MKILPPMYFQKSSSNSDQVLQNRLYHERLTSSDGFFDNMMVAINNVFTLVFVVSLAMLSFDFLIAQITFQESDDIDMDGELTLEEFLNILCAFLLLIASIIRICVNSVEKTKFGVDSGSEHRLAYGVQWALSYYECVAESLSQWPSNVFWGTNIKKKI